MIDPDLYRIIDAISEPDLCYEYNELCVFQRVSDRRLFYAMDSGCSCPIPFENCTIADLVPYTRKAIRAWAMNARADPAELIRLCEEALS